VASSIQSRIRMAGDLVFLLDKALGGVGETERALQYLARSAKDEELHGAAAVVVCGDPADVTAPQWAAHALKVSCAPVVIISGGAGPDGTGRLLQNAKHELNQAGGDVEELSGGLWRLPLASEVHGEWVKPAVPPQHDLKKGVGLDPEQATKHLTEADIYLELMLNKLRQIEPSIGLKDVAVGINDMPAAADKKLRIVIENKSTHSGENAEFAEALLRPYLHEFKPSPGQVPKIISVKAPLLLKRGTSTLRKEKGKVPKSVWLGGDVQLVSYAAPCPELSELDPLRRVEVLAQAAGEYKRLLNYNHQHLDLEADFPHSAARAFAALADALTSLMSAAGGISGCGTKRTN